MRETIMAYTKHVYEYEGGSFRRCKAHRESLQKMMIQQIGIT